jgi:hypothetical protein
MYTNRKGRQKGREEIINQLMSQSINEPINQSINQSIFSQIILQIIFQKEYTFINNIIHLYLHSHCCTSGNTPHEAFTDTPTKRRILYISSDATPFWKDVGPCCCFRRSVGDSCCRCVGHVSYSLLKVLVGNMCCVR